MDIARLSEIWFSWALPASWQMALLVLFVALAAFLLRNDRQEPACAKCPFSFVCPKALVEPWLIHLAVGEAGLARRVFERECAINRKLLRRVCEDLLRFSERNVGDALPLKLQITPARDLTFIPRDPETPELEPRMDTDEHG